MTITVHNIVTGTHTYEDVDALIVSIAYWYDFNRAGGCQLEVSQNERLIMMTFAHYNFDDGDSHAVIIKDELPADVDVDKLFRWLKSCS